MVIILTAIAVTSVLALFFGLLLGYAAIQFKVESNPL